MHTSKHHDSFPEGHHRPDAHRSLPVPPERPAAPKRSKGPLIMLTALGAAAVTGVSLGGAALTGSAAPASNTTTPEGDLVVPAKADTYVVRERPGARFGDAKKIAASVWPRWHSEAYVSFVVPRGAERVRHARVELTFDRSANRPDLAELRLLLDGWSESATGWENRPLLGPVLATAKPGEDGRLVFDVSASLDKPGLHSFAITNPGSRSAVSVHSRESGDKGPRLVLSNRAPSTAAPKPPAPGPTATTKPPAPGAEPTWQVPPAPDAKPRPGRQTLCGASLNLQNGENFQQALDRMDREYGGLEMVRLFYSGVPPAWPGRVNVSKRPQVVSFKLDPRDVLSGKHDAEMSKWYADAPRDQDVYWVYYHEPEDNIAKGEFSAADYRAAWKRLRGLADKAANPRLKATLVLMGWSTHPNSGRNWRDYYPGRDVVQVLGWDVYNLTYEKGQYEDPVQMYDEVIAVSKAEGLPFGVAETGSYLTPGDSGAQRAAWLRKMNDHLSKAGALWVAYFDLNWHSGDFRLQDAPSRQAWRDFC
ncbi:hypothetical protein ACIBF1_22240 [Spirillospora sp. NPDC050679]